MASPSSSSNPSRRSSVVDKVREVAVADARAEALLVKDAIKSQVWLYPFKGMYVFFWRNPELSRPLREKVFKVLGTAASVLGAMFTFTYLIQAAILTLFNGPLAVFSTVFLILNESSTITSLLTHEFFTKTALVDTFDGTLMTCGQGELVAQGRILRNRSSASDVIDRMGRFIKKPFDFGYADMIRSCLYLFLNLVPIIGPVLYVLARSRQYGPRIHSRYFQLKSMSKKKQDDWRQSHAAEYASFALPAMLLEMIPIAGIVFSFTNTVGAALWAAEIERNKPRSQAPRPASQNQEPTSQSAITEPEIPTEDPPAYTEE